MPSRETSISLEALWITFTLVLLGFLLCFLLWAIVRHFSYRHRHAQHGYDDTADDVESQRSFLKDLAREFGYRPRNATSNADISSKLLIVKNSYRPHSGSSWRASLVQKSSCSGSGRPLSSSTSPSSKAAGDNGGGSVDDSTKQFARKSKTSTIISSASHHSQVCLEVIQEDEDE